MADHPLGKDHLAQALGANISVVGVERDARVVKAEAELLQSRQINIEDDQFSKYYLGSEQRGDILKPPYNPTQLSSLIQTNNTLGLCVAAMEVNIDGTGHVIERKDGQELTEKDDSLIEQLNDFWNEPSPGVSFVTMRRLLRRDMESVGWGYLEVIRNRDRKIVFLRHVDAKTVRMVRMDAPRAVQRTITRMGKEQTVMTMERTRRYCQLIENALVYYKSFGVERDLNWKTGLWQEEGAEAIPDDQKATELMYFGAMPDVVTPYHVPRWIAQIPSVLGSRKAEEFNLEFFDSGGLPPVVVLLQGGSMQKEHRDELTAYLAGKAKYKQRAVVAEIYPTSGDLNSANNVKVNVERFGGERQQDSMFEKYDERCFERVRMSFRLPPLLVGKTEDYNRATAFASYLVAEAQVFKPEREEFDEIINVTIMKELAPEYVFRSMPLSVKDMEEQLKAFELVKEDLNPQDRVAAINEMVGMALPIPTEEELKARQEQARQIANRDAGDEEDIAKSSDDVLLQLAEDWTSYLSGDKEFTDDQVASMQKMIDTMTAKSRKLLASYVGLRLVPSDFDHAGSSDLIECASHHVGRKKRRAARGY